MNVFDQRNKANESLKNRAQIFVRLSAQSISVLGTDGDSDQLPDFVQSSSGFHVEVFEFDDHQYVPNPNYKPGLTSEEYRKPENLSVDAGFSSTTVISKMCRICAVENQPDMWDDCAGEPGTWSLEHIPQELFLYGSESDIVDFFTERYKSSIDRENENKFREKWAPFFNSTIEEIDEFCKAARPFAGSGHSFWKYFDEITNSLKEISNANK